MSELMEALLSHQQSAMELLRIAAAASEQIDAEERLYLQEEKGMKHLRDSVANIELGVMAQVASAKDEETGRSIFTNDALRKAEVADRLSNNGVYLDTNRRLGEAITAQAIREIQIKRLNREHQLSKLAYEGLMIGRRER